jgi:hypothetical protein
MSTLAERKCKIISEDAYKPGSQVVVLATQNQFLWDYERDNDGSIMSDRMIETVKSIIRSQVGVVNKLYAGKYGEIDNITWDDFTRCKSMHMVKDSDGKPIQDSDGKIQYKNFDRQSLAELSYAPHTKYMPNFRPFEDSEIMQKLCTFVPLRLDAYYPPEVVVLFVLFILLTLTIVILWLIFSKSTPKRKRRYAKL